MQNGKYPQTNLNTSKHLKPLKQSGNDKRAEIERLKWLKNIYENIRKDGKYKLDFTL